jgi:hypothetical protein
VDTIIYIKDECIREEFMNRKCIKDKDIEVSSGEKLLDDEKELDDGCVIYIV